MRHSVLHILRCILLSFPLAFLGNIAIFADDTCPSCGQSYSDFTHLAVHAVSKHALWLCPNCRETFPVKDKKSYRLHRIKEHKEAVWFACNLRVFRSRIEWTRHLEKHWGKDVCFVPPCNLPCCLQLSLSKRNSVWSQQLHGAHFHGSWLDFFVTVRLLYRCCKPFREAILTDYSDHLKSDGSNDMKKKFLKGIRNFSKHVYDKHGLCFLCERRLTSGIDKDIFDSQSHIGTNVFLRSGSHVLALPKDENLTCFCGKRAQRNAESRLFALKIDRLPFGTGLDTVTHPFYCTIDDGKNEKKKQPEKLKAGTAMPSKSDANSRKYSEEPKENPPKAPQSPSFSTKSVDTTFASTDDKKHKKLPVSDTDGVLLKGNGTNGDVFKNL